MSETSLIITTIADSAHPVLQLFAKEAAAHSISMVVVGDLKSPETFDLPGCEYYSPARQKEMPLALTQLLPFNHYARKNLGYLAAIGNGAAIIIETDDDNLPYDDFWRERKRKVMAHPLIDCGWVNAYGYFTDLQIWPRGFALECMHNKLPDLPELALTDCPIQQGLANLNPDVDALYRLLLPLPVTFNQADNLALGRNSFCPFNSQNTTWFRDAFPLLYLPSYCSFRMTDIWRSFIAQRIAWECDWNLLFHSSTVWQERNDHNLMKDFKDEIPGYLNNNKIFSELTKLQLQRGAAHIPENMRICYNKMIELGLVGAEEKDLLNAWLQDISKLI